MKSPLGDKLVDCKIGFVSKEPPGQKKFNGTVLYWFNEIEALYAFLLGDSLDRIVLDKSVTIESNSCVLKYQKLIEPMHPGLKFEIYDLKNASGEIFISYHYFPTLKTMFKNGELKNMFQPIVKGYQEGHEIIGFECLSRIYFNNSQFAPDFLFNYAQEKQELTNYDKICLAQSLSLAPQLKNVSIFVNVRPQTLISHNFYPWFKEQLKKYNLDPRNIVVEITEQNCVISEREMAFQCDLLKSQGIRIALDDFGSGISNLSLLEITKPNIIKISGRFIKGSDNDPIKQKIIKNIFDLAKSFEIQAIVENVEIQPEWLQVLQLGITLAQGFYFYRPMSKDDLMTALKKLA